MVSSEKPPVRIAIGGFGLDLWKKVVYPSWPNGLSGSHWFSIQAAFFKIRPTAGPMRSPADETNRDGGMTQ
ncbi:MAG: hypothetical protein ACOC98_12910, partial [Thermodesulfobacteriota bacterium]